MAETPAEGVTLSGVWFQTGTKNGCGSGESREAGTEGAKQTTLLNLSGKRTEWAFRNPTNFLPIFSPEQFAYGVFSLQKYIKMR